MSWLNKRYSNKKLKLFSEFHSNTFLAAMVQFHVTEWIKWENDSFIVSKTSTFRTCWTVMRNCPVVKHTYKCLLTHAIKLILRHRSNEVEKLLTFAIIYSYAAACNLSACCKQDWVFRSLIHNLNTKNDHTSNRELNSLAACRCTQKDERAWIE